MENFMPLNLFVKLIEGGIAFMTETLMLFDPLTHKSNKLIERYSDSAIFYIILLISCLVIYFIAVRFSKKTSCIIVYGLGDIALLVLPYVIFAIIAINSFIRTNGGEFPDEAISLSGIVPNIIYISPLIASFCISVVSNRKHSGSLLYIVISIIGKIAVFFYIGIFIMLVCFVLAGWKKDKKGKTNTLATALKAGLIIFLATFFVKGVLKLPDNVNNSDDDDEEEYDDDEEEEYEDDEEEYEDDEEEYEDEEDDAYEDDEEEYEDNEEAYEEESRFSFIRDFNRNFNRKMKAFLS